MYKKRTPLLGLPYMSAGEKLTEKNEKEKALILENLLFAGINGIAKMILEDGNYNVYDNGDKTVTLIITPEVKYTLLGIVNYTLFKSEKEIIFDKIPKGSFYYIYACYTDEMCTDATKFRKVVTDIPKRNEFFVLLATLDLTKETPILDETPDDKLYSKEVMAHISDSSNPHGRDLHQDKLTIHDSLKINESPVYETVYMDLEFNGSAGTKIEIPGKEVVFVNVMPIDSCYGSFWVELRMNIAMVKCTNEIVGKFKAEIKVK